MRAFLWLLRREIWEHKALWIAPAVTIGVILLSALWGGIALIGSDDAMAQIDAEMGNILDGEARALVYITTLTVASVVATVMLVVVFFYLLDCLYAERKDRSILFWRALPVSDLRTVLSKLAVALVVVPALVVAALVAYLLLHHLLLGTLLVLGTDLSLGQFTSLGALVGSVVSMGSLLLYAGLWYLPFFGWLLLVSAWARRAPFLWAVLLPAGIMLAERIALQSRYFADMLGAHLAAAFDYTATDWAGDPRNNLITEEGLTETLVTWPVWLDGLGRPEMWTGIVIGLAFVGGAVAIRRYRGETA